MKALIVLAAIVALGAARPSYWGYGGYPYVGGLPQPVTDTPEVAHAKAAHFAAVAAAGGIVPASASYLGGLPQPVTDTPEVAHAKAAHFAAVARAAQGLPVGGPYDGGYWHGW